jgi:hypothetical protein
MQIDSALKAFADNASISPSVLSLLIRIGLLGAFFIWATWCVLELLKFYRNHPHASVANLLKDYVQVFILISIVISLVFIK